MSLESDDITHVGKDIRWVVIVIIKNSAEKIVSNTNSNYFDQIFTLNF
jgi:hypothetical protein